MSAPVETAPPPDCMNAPSRVKLAAFAKVSCPALTMITVPSFPAARVSTVELMVTMLVVSERPPVPSRMTGPLRRVVPVPAVWLRVLALRASSNVTSFACVIEMSPRSVVPPTTPVKRMSPASEFKIKSSAKSVVPSRVDAKVIVPPVESILMLSVSVTAELKVTSSSVVVISAPVETVPPPSSVKEPPRVRVAALSIESSPEWVIATSPLSVVLMSPLRVVLVEEEIVSPVTAFIAPIVLSATLPIPAASISVNAPEASSINVMSPAPVPVSIVTLSVSVTALAKVTLSLSVVISAPVVTAPAPS